MLLYSEGMVVSIDGEYVAERRNTMGFVPLPRGSLQRELSVGTPKRQPLEKVSKDTIEEDISIW